MAENSSDGVTPEPRKGLFGFLKRQPQCSIGRMLVVGILGGIMIWGGLNMGMEYTNRSDFCMSCHEMTIPFEELKKTVHYKNRSGTTVQCADCHVASSKTPDRLHIQVVPEADGGARRDRPHQGHPRHAREIRGAPSDDGRARLGTHEGSRLQGMPQLPRLQDHGPGEAEGPLGDQTRRRHRRRQDLHRLPQGHRAQAGASSEEGPGASSASCRAGTAQASPAPAKAAKKSPLPARHRPRPSPRPPRRSHRHDERDDNGGHCRAHRCRDRGDRCQPAKPAKSEAPRPRRRPSRRWTGAKCRRARSRSSIPARPAWSGS
jgi:hypothetical protein